MEEMRQILFLIGVAFPTLGAIGLFMIKTIMDVSKRVATLEGRHIEIDRHDMEDK